ncbi:MAG: MucR family transcriptional regulator [Magnetococcales bacterium]|nr:MucR family transcriptional regulator [Magnetococcales bacterium]MBF0156206.1 MucR family transcriptional regulator [Magnetococcales bacterium]
MSLVKFTTQIVESFVSRNEISPEALPALVKEIFRTLSAIAAETEAGQETPSFGTRQMVEELFQGTGRTLLPERERHLPVIPIAEAVTAENVYCLICGKATKALKSHLTRSHHLKVHEYRNRFNLPKDFPMVAPTYSKRRRELALEAGLGERPKNIRDPSIK